MAHIPKINFTGSALATTVQTIINTRDQKKNKVTSGIPTTETLADVYGTRLPSSTMVNGLNMPMLHSHGTV